MTATDERGGLCGTRPCDTRVIHEATESWQVTVGEFLRLHVTELVAVVRDGWPFAGHYPTAREALRLAVHPVATPLRAAVTAGLIVATVLVVLVAHAATS